MERMQKRYEGKEKKTKKGKRKTGVQGGVPLSTADTNFPKERKKNKWMIRTKKKQRSMFSMQLVFYKISLGHLYYNSNIPTHNTLEFGGYRGQPFAKQLHL